MTDPTQRLREIEERWKAASPGNWFARRAGNEAHVMGTPLNPSGRSALVATIPIQGDAERLPPNAVALGCAWQDIAWLIERVRELEAASTTTWNEAIEEAASMACSCCDNPIEIRKELLRK